MRILPSHVIPIFLNQGMVTGQIAAQIMMFDVYYKLPPVVGFSVVCSDDVGSGVVGFQVVDPQESEEGVVGFQVSTSGNDAGVVGFYVSDED